MGDPGNKPPYFRLQPRLRRRAQFLDIAMAIVVGGISGVYIFNDTLRKVSVPSSTTKNAVAASTTTLKPKAKE
jgi:hypothetical protein